MIPPDIFLIFFGIAPLPLGSCGLLLDPEHRPKTHRKPNIDLRGRKILYFFYNIVVIIMVATKESLSILKNLKDIL